VDVSAQYDVKRRALACHVTQFAPSSGDAVATRLTSARFQQLVESRDAQFGALVGVAYAEGLVVKYPILASHLLEGGAG
jgi:LmbE family N-acetylglucosaminyl deacetylase